MPGYRVERSIEINADPQRVFAVASDFGQWTMWSPWLIAEPETKVTVTPNANAVGAVYAWEGKITGQGEVEHIRLTPDSSIDDELRFIKPFKSIAKCQFQLTPSGHGTRLMWSMDGNMPWFMFWMIPMLKTFIGMDFQRGLNMLKDLIETGTIASRSVVHDVQPIGPVRMAGVIGSCEVTNVGPSMDAAFGQAKDAFLKNGLSTDGLMMSVYTKFKIAPGVFEYIAGYMIPESVDVPAASGLKVWSLPACRAFRVEHIGSYRHLGNPWSIANQLVRHRKLKQSRVGTFEIYRTTPPETPESELQTDIYLPLR